MSTDPSNAGASDVRRLQEDGLQQSAERGLRIARRSFVFFGALFVAGCATSKSQVASGRLPGPEWPDIPAPVPPAPAGAICRAPKPGESVGECTPPPAPPETAYGGPVPFARPRSTWAHGTPDYSDMDRMLPPKYITIHHDGMTPYWGLTETEARERLELIRNGHRGKGWSDIGYHYIVDRSGVVWQGRDVTRWQGAHVKFRNENNIGVMCLGNFMLQAPSPAQVASLNRTVAQLRAYYKLRANVVKTHQEWPGAQTLCPGTYLQAQVNVLRKSGFKSSALA
jgi:hypothetical protein